MPISNSKGPELHFKAVVRKGGGAGTTCFVELPGNSTEFFGTRARVPIIGEVNGFPIRTSALPTGGGNHQLMFNAEMRAGSAAGPGDTVDVRLRVDRRVRKVELPEDFAAALAENQAVQERWNALSYSHQREYVTWIEGAKRPQTRARRLNVAVHRVRAAKRAKE